MVRDPMDRIATKFAVAILTMLALSQACAGCQAQPEHEIVNSASVSRAQYPSTVVPSRPEVAVPRQVSLDLPNTCDPLLVVVVAQDVRLSKVKPDWLRDKAQREHHQAEIRGIVDAVAEEMGADALASEYLFRVAIEESSGNESALHILNPDLQANRGASRRARAQTSERWSDARVPVFRRHRGELVEVADYDAWSLGRGLYGMISTYTLRWSADAPPWSLCDPVVATVTAIWAIRDGLLECKGKTLRDANRRFRSGRCALRDEKREHAFDRLARGNVRGLKRPRFDPDTRANFGDRWPEATTDRSELLAVLRSSITSRSETPTEP